MNKKAAEPDKSATHVQCQVCMMLSFLLFLSAHASVCEIEEIPLKERISDSTMIFTGEVISDSMMEKLSPEMDRFGVVRVEKVYKGNPGKEIKVYYRKRISGLDDECNGKVFEGFYNVLKNSELNRKMLFYTKEINGVQTTSDERFGGSVKFSQVKKQIQVLEESLK